MSDAPHYLENVVIHNKTKKMAIVNSSCLWYSNFTFPDFILCLMCKNNRVWTFELTAAPYQITVDIFIINLIKLTNCYLAA